MDYNTQFNQMDPARLKQLNGGGFAYDVGRGLRFLVMCGGGFTVTNAVIDWIINDVANDAVNN
jgi:hypothetical protein